MAVVTRATFPDFIKSRYMPLTRKGRKVLSAMKRQYGEKKGKKVFYASANKGRIRGVHKGSGRLGVLSR